MTAQQIIKALSDLGVTRYKIASDTGISQMNLSRWLKGTQPHDSNVHFINLKKYYNKRKKPQA